MVYLDGAGTITESAAITLNGTTPVAAGFTATAVEWMEVFSVGSGEVSVGNIRLRIVAGAVEVEQVTAGGNRSQSARFTVPLGYSAYLPSWRGSAINNDQDMRLRADLDSFDRSLVLSVYHFQDQLYIPLNQTQQNDLPMLKIPAGATVKVSTLSAGIAATVRADTSFSIVLIKD